MTNEAIKTLPHAVIDSRLDYCNVRSIAEGLLSRLQSVENAAVRLVTGLVHNTCPVEAPLATGSSAYEVSWRLCSTARLQELPDLPTSVTSLHLLECTPALN